MVLACDCTKACAGAANGSPVGLCGIFATEEGDFDDGDDSYVHFLKYKTESGRVLQPIMPEVKNGTGGQK